MANSKLKNFVIVPNGKPLVPASGKRRGLVYSKGKRAKEGLEDLFEFFGKHGDRFKNADPKDYDKILDEIGAPSGLKKRLAQLGLGGAGAMTTAGIFMRAAQGGLDLAKTAAEGALRGLEEAVGINVPESIGGLAGEIVKLTVKLDDLQKDVGRATGMFVHLGQNVQGIARQFRHLGVTYERTAKAMIALDKGFSQLNVTTRTQQYALLQFTHQMENLGVSADVTGKALEVFARGTFSTQQSAIRATKSIIQFSREIRYKGGPAQMAADIMAIGPMLNKYGSATETTLKQMAVQARKTGLEMKQIFDVSDQMDTFEDASEMIGRLNANFGLGLNAVTLMQANEAERRQIVVDRFHSMYGTFDNLDRRQKQTMGQLLGFGSNIQDTRKYFEEQGMASSFGMGFDASAQAATKFSETAQAANEELITKMKGDSRVSAVVDELVGTLSNFNSALAYSTTVMSYSMKGEGIEKILGIKGAGHFMRLGAQATAAGRGPTATGPSFNMGGLGKTIALGSITLPDGTTETFNSQAAYNQRVKELQSRGMKVNTTTSTQTYDASQGLPPNFPSGGTIPTPPGVTPPGTTPPMGRPPAAGMPFPEAGFKNPDGPGYLTEGGIIALDTMIARYGPKMVEKFAADTPGLFDRIRFGKASPDEISKAFDALDSKSMRISKGFKAGTKGIKVPFGGQHLLGTEHGKTTRLNKILDRQNSLMKLHDEATGLGKGRTASLKGLSKSALKTGAKRLLPAVGDIVMGGLEAQAEIAAGADKTMAYGHEAAGAAGGVSGFGAGASLGLLTGPAAPVMVPLLGILGAMGGEELFEMGFRGITGHKTQAQKVEENNQARAKQHKAAGAVLNKYHNDVHGPQASADGVKGKLDANLHFHLPNGDVKEVKTQLEATLSPLGTRNRNRPNNRPAAINNINVQTV